MDNQFTKQENKIRDRYINKHSHYFDKLEPVDNIYSNYDVYGERRGKKYYIELKERSERYPLCQYSGSTRMEVIKLNFFKGVIEDDSDAECLYVNYYSAGEDYISFNISERIRSADDFEEFPTMMQASNFKDRTKVEKMVVDLGYSNKYGDKMVINNNIVKIIQ